MAAPIPQEQIDAWQAQGRRRAILEATPPANLGAATTFHDDGQLLYRGRTYRTRSVPYREGLWLHGLAFDLRQILEQEPTEAILRETLKIFDAMVDLMWSLVRWRSKWRHLGRNPFRDAEALEVTALADFFSLARMRSPVEGWASVRAPAWLQLTTRTRPSSSLVGIRASWRTTASRAAGGTLRMA